MKELDELLEKATPGPCHITEFINVSTPHTPSGNTKRIVSTGGDGFVIAARNSTVCEGRRPVDGRLLTVARNNFKAVVEALEELAERAERARSILRKDGNWGMLDTVSARATLAAIEKELEP